MNKPPAHDQANAAVFLLRAEDCVRRKQWEQALADLA
jgi:hypothetical protein